MKKKQVFFQDTGIFGDEFMVSCGMTEKELRAFMKKARVTDDFIKGTFDSGFTEEKTVGAGHTYFNADTHQVYHVSLPKVSDEWRFWEALIHEVCHVVQCLEYRKMIMNDLEARAYLTDYLFRSIRRKIMGLK